MKDKCTNYNIAKIHLLFTKKKQRRSLAIDYGSRAAENARVALDLDFSVLEQKQDASSLTEFT